MCQRLAAVGEHAAKYNLNIAKYSLNITQAYVCASDWRLWENMQLVSMAIGRLQKACEATAQVLEANTT